MTLGPVLVAAGGTGGHLFPAEALTKELSTRGVAVELVTDPRGKKYDGDFPAQAVHQIPSATPSGGSLLARAKAVLTLLGGTVAALWLIGSKRPAAVVGFGGYPSVPPVFAATLLRVPTILHEQNAVMGRANRFLAARVDAVAHGFPTLKGLGSGIKAHTYHTGNPVRPSVLAAAKVPYRVPDDGTFDLLVTGGSQGARVMADIVPPAIALLTPQERVGLRIVQQARGEDQARVTKAYQELAVAAEVLPFFSDLPTRVAAASLVIARAGASTVSELAVIGRPSILVPFPHALDQDQAANAEELAATGAAQVVRESEFTPQWLAAALRAARQTPQGLASRAAAAQKAGIDDAAKRLADLVTNIALGNKKE
ncbi:undecaprenyldiphospho-muramoylpentapeptide beta-N-acetylglucosaminyltransferase [Methylovirgula ligni]|uniref:UDP-N-acetylglucosamine--N-acetylmuramyl-(pentapeptide) pyrophosphoryl-undecaprenol N-acetylglucosamine transferase n=1 Tax=Methylovirgula ligni TaxID=569860 RepID=A0A3D9Z4U7_9HYPH|nr:undecaprenyldiphospho-muramoylpentapeptide beta-N-acetylglucosaminyltransferase [Methylovirgula ligni]QAY96134.1 undecaprenyldiphospho-muramoylpentapeptide beta-N-acetylglucosaminyltransferase [Methylovirgula ligni]REF86179.1 UDP-N-acetylglucosamine-N-acetylmuramylpentapeptide N-acetylglucosamine transferase [Methylovirgula ligni]